MRIIIYSKFSRQEGCKKEIRLYESRNLMVYSMRFLSFNRKEVECAATMVFVCLPTLHKIKVSCKKAMIFSCQVFLLDSSYKVFVLYVFYSNFYVYSYIL